MPSTRARRSSARPAIVRRPNVCVPQSSAFAQAGALRARGLDVLLIVDSLARIAAAAREIALAAGEAPGRGGFPPSVFAVLARLLERAGPHRAGSAPSSRACSRTAPTSTIPSPRRRARPRRAPRPLRTARHARALSRRRPGASASRTFADCAGRGHLAAARLPRAAVAALDESRDARGLGIDAAAGDPFLARCLVQEAAITAFLQQDGVPSPFARTLAGLEALTEPLRA